MSVLIKPEPFSSTEVNRLFNTFFGPTDPQSASQRWMPEMDLVEAEDHFALRADLPGLGEDDVSIEVRDNTLTISGERKAEASEKDRGFYRVERSFGRFSRSLTLPEGIDAEAVTAAFDRGVLEVRIPKPQERRPRVVTIQAGARPEPVEGKVISDGGAEVAEPSEPLASPRQ